MKDFILVVIIGLVFITGCESIGFSEKAKAELRYKKITPKMELQMADFMKRGCNGGGGIFDNDLAQMYSIIPGGGQFYTGETKKGLYYLFGSIFIVPYFASFQDAQNSVDYYNFQYDIDYCKEKQWLTRKIEGKKGKADLFK